MKQRFSSLDVKIIAHELSQSLTSLRVSNIYDLSSRIFLFKFAKPEHRQQLLVDAGFRCHLSDFARSTAAAPSAFVARLRKFLKTRRVTSISQVGTDRVIEISFSDGLYFLYLEFYAGGNLILTDKDHGILALWRTVSEGAEHEQFKVGTRYDLSQRQNFAGVPPLTKERIREGLEKAVARAEAAEAQNKKMKRKQGDALRKALATSITEYPPILLDHSLQAAGFDKDLQPAEVVKDETLLQSLLEALDVARKTVEDITNAPVAKGFILVKTKPGKPGDNGTVPQESLIYDDYQPFRPCQFGGQDLKFLEYEGFNKTIDEFYSSIEGQKLESRLQEREDQAKRRIENARAEHDKRIGGLQQVQESNILKAQAIEANLDRVEEVRAAVNGLIGQGMDWKDIDKLIEREQTRDNPVAMTLKVPLKLQENTVTLLLAGFEVDEDDFIDESDSEASDSDEQAVKKVTEDKRIAVDIDLAQSAWANSRLYHDQKRVAAAKQDRTVQASTKALQNTEQRIQADLKKGLKQEKQLLHPVRKQFWFEKFNWFLSSDGYLVLSGKDTQQNDLLYQRHLKKGDVYIHADLNGAASVIVKNNPATPEAPIPPSTLSQAGSVSVCSSSAWESKAVMSAWWVNADQVSKTTAAGDYLSPGSFAIKGTKNFLPPAQLLLGFAVVWQVSEESKARHMKHRAAPTVDAEHATKSDILERAVNEPQLDAMKEDEDDAFPDVDEDDDFPDVEDHDAVTEGEHHEDDGHETASENGDDRVIVNPLQPVQAQAKSDITAIVSSHPAHDGDAEVDAGAGSDSDDDQPPQVASTDAASVQVDDKKQSKGAQSTTQQANSAKTQPTQPVRGKRGKAKKIADKYADQDEEDRELAMSLLGIKKAQDESATTPETPQVKETPEQARARRREQHEKTQKAGLEAERLRQLSLEDNHAAADDTTEDTTTSLTSILESLVGTPLPGDEILEAIPVCAPWSALGKYKYKVKLQPGSLKKGKAVREILARWVKDGSETKRLDHSAQDTERIWPREAELVRTWKETEVVGVVPVKSLKVVQSGGADKKASAGGKGGKGGRGGKGGKKR